MTAFRQSIEAMIPALRRYARALARDADIADDLVQDTLVRALRSERLFLGGDVRSWLYTILTNLNKNRRRSLARRPQFMPLLDNNPDASGTEAEGRRHSGRADRHRNVPACPRPRPCESLARRRARRAAAGEMMTAMMRAVVMRQKPNLSMPNHIVVSPQLRRCGCTAGIGEPRR
jgi:DNA-directed RNA polymerase specialized sigma24 family protein